jgi:hypothetical protein
MPPPNMPAPYVSDAVVPSPAPSRTFFNRYGRVLVGGAAIVAVIVGVSVLSSGDDEAYDSTREADATFDNDTYEPIADDDTNGQWPRVNQVAFVESCLILGTPEGCACGLARAQATWTLSEIAVIEAEMRATGVMPDEVVALFETC